ncbi:MAG: acetylxylan esterase [Planctomycetota bacterium]|nr:acetylxylan esterase [Planctomycetota bacterium]
MNAPEDFGLPPAQTLAHVADRTPALGHSPYWMQWAEALSDLEPAFTESSRSIKKSEDPGAPGVTHTFESLRSTRIGCRIIEPASETRGVIITTHGYETPAELTDDHPWPDHDLAVIKLRVRGYPGSQLDTGPLTQHPGGWITHGLERADTWILPLAVADLVNAFRAARTRYGEETPISIHGESFGGGLAVLAAAQLAGREFVHRMSIALPTLGDWTWRVRNFLPRAVGINADIAAFLHTHASIENEILHTLRISDAAIHAPRVVCPVLCKLALRDEVVPAPTAASVFNALGTSPTMKWRYITRFGHFDGGIADLRRHGHFDRLSASFLDPAEDLIPLMRSWADRLSADAPAPTA